MKNNYQKFTKSELISKLKWTESKVDSNKNSISNQIKSYFTQILNLLYVFKDILIKLTLVSFFIQILKRYRIFRRLWIMLNTIVMTIFGLSIIDNFGFEFISNILLEFKFITSNIVDYLTNTKFYSYLRNLFSKKEIISSENKFPSSGSNVETNSIETTRNEKTVTENQGNSRISDWLKNDRNQEEISEDIPTSNIKKYIICGTVIIVVSCLSWYYWAELKKGGDSLVEWIWSNWPKSSNNGESDTDSSTTPTKINPTTGSVDTSRSNSPDIILDDRKFTSPSLEELNDKVTESWSERPTSPTSSTSSTETIKASSSNISGNDNLSWGGKLQDLSSQGGDFLNLVRDNWRYLLNYNNLIYIIY